MPTFKPFMGTHGPLGRLLLGAGLAGLLLVALLLAPAFAGAAEGNYEFFKKVGEPGSEGALRAGSVGVAVNDTTGDVYLANGEDHDVVVFTGEGVFKEKWGWGVKDGKEEFERCGPKECAGAGLPGEGAGEFHAATSIAVNQANGCVYVQDGVRQTGQVQVFTAKGELVGSFGVRGAETAEDIQFPGVTDTLTVTNSGNVYLIDSGEVFGPRVMEFRPKVAGECKNYSYARELLGPTSNKDAKFTIGLATDNAEDLYVGHENEIFKFVTEKFTKPAWHKAATNAEALAADPVTGTVFYYNAKTNEVFELDGTAGETLKKFPSVSGMSGASGAAFNPNSPLAGRPAGVLYVVMGFNPATKVLQGLLIFAKPGSPVKPEIKSTAVEKVGPTSATVSAEINPDGATVDYAFRYGTTGPCSSNPCPFEVPSGGAPLSSTSGVQSVSATLTGLAPNSKYYFQAVLKTAPEVKGAALAFKTFPSPQGSPDGRVYEMVSPPDKNGGEVFSISEGFGTCVQCEPGAVDNIPMPAHSSLDGNSVVYAGFPFAASGEAVNENEYRATRTSSGWQTRDIAPELLTREGLGYRAVSPDLSHAILGQTEPTLSPGALTGGLKDLYLENEAGELTPLVTTQPLHRKARGEQAFTVSLAGGPGAESADYSHIVIEANDALTGVTAHAPAAEDGGPLSQNLYEWVNGELRLVNVLPGNASTVTNAALGSGTELSSTESEATSTNAVSSDGSRIFWSSIGTSQAYVRENGELTMELPDHNGTFLMAASDGSKVLLSDGHIYDLETTLTVDLTKGAGGFQGFMGASEDLSRVYFIDTAVLTGAEKNSRGKSAEAAHDNLYLYDANAGKTVYVATLLPEDNLKGINNIEGAWKPAPGDRLAQTSADGRYVTFMSLAGLTGYDSAGGACGKTACPEIFEYSQSANELVCVSCSPTGAPPEGLSKLPLARPIGSHFGQPHFLTADGRVFFDSTDRLSSEATVPGAENVYEFERAGQGSCAEPEGCIQLISSGHSEHDAIFLDATPSTGRDVFFTTRARLVPEDVDNLGDLYDAREGGGITSVPGPAPCAGESCWQPSPPAPTFITPATAAFSGPGNLTPVPPSTKPSTHPKPKKCPRGKVRNKHGRCVKRHKGGTRGKGGKP